MRRRMRPSRRPFRPVPTGQPGTRAQALLRRAHQSLENGNHAQAAQMFQQLAEAARDIGRLRYAPNLFLQAGRAYLLSGNIKDGSECLYTGLEIIAQAEKWPALARAGSRLIDEVESLGHPALSAEISAWLASALPEPIDHYRQTITPPKPMPLKCPFCGGALRPGEVGMLDSVTGECPYCGSAIRP